MRAARRYSLASKTRRSDHRKGYDRFTVEVGGCEVGAAWLVAREIFAAPGSTLHGGHEVDTHHEWVRGSREALQERDDLATGQIIVWGVHGWTGAHRDLRLRRPTHCVGVDPLGIDVVEAADTVGNVPLSILAAGWST